MIETVLEATNGAKLPPGWQRRTLDEVCERRTGTRDPRQQPEGQFRYVDITSVDNNLKRIVEARVVRNENAPSRARQVIRAGDVILSTTRPNLNAVAMVPSELDGEICSTGFCVLRATPDLDATFLFHFVRSREFVTALSELVKGALYPAVTDRQVRDQLIPFPPLPEQRRIAAKLTEQMLSVERARRAAEEQLHTIGQLPSALLDQAFRGLILDKLTGTLPAGWRRVRLRECTEEVTEGVGTDWRKYKLFGVSRQGIANPKQGLGKQPERYKVVQPGAIFYNPMRILLGSIGTVDDGEEAGITSPDYVVFTTRAGLLHHRWFYYWLRSRHGATFIRSMARGAVRERMLYNRLADGELIIPPWQVQVETASSLRKLATVREQANARAELIDTLPSALITAAFSGNL